MKERQHWYFYVGTKPPRHELSTDSWGVKHLYLNDDVFKARRQRDVFNEAPTRKKGQPRYRIFRLRFTEVF